MGKLSVAILFLSAAAPAQVMRGGREWRKIEVQLQPPAKGKVRAREGYLSEPRP